MGLCSLSLRVRLSAQIFSRALHTAVGLWSMQSVGVAYSVLVALSTSAWTAPGVQTLSVGVYRSHSLSLAQKSSQG